MRTTGLMLWLSLGGLAVVAGCGGGGARDGGTGAQHDSGQPPADAGLAPACGDVPPCGGDLVGSWTFGAECDSPAQIASIKSDFATMAEPTWCAIQRLVTIAPQASGSLQFGADGTYALDLVYGGYLDINYPQSCLVSFTCDDLTAELQSEIAAGSFPLASVSSIACSGSSSCLCRATVSSESAASGTYTVAGTVVTFTATTGAVTNKSFCVAGGALHILDTSAGSSGQTTVDSDVVASRLGP